MHTMLRAAMLAHACQGGIWAGHSHQVGSANKAVAPIKLPQAVVNADTARKWRWAKQAAKP